MKTLTNLWRTSEPVRPSKDMMYKKEKKLGYSSMPTYEAVQLPYNDGSTFFTVILPKEGMKAVHSMWLFGAILYDMRGNTFWFNSHRINKCKTIVIPIVSSHFYWVCFAKTNAINIKLGELRRRELRAYSPWRIPWIGNSRLDVNRRKRSGLGSAKDRAAQDRYWFNSYSVFIFLSRKTTKIWQAKTPYDRFQKATPKILPNPKHRFFSVSLYGFGLFLLRFRLPSEGAGSLGLGGGGTSDAALQSRSFGCNGWGDGGWWMLMEVTCVVRLVGRELKRSCKVGISNSWKWTFEIL